MYKIELQYFKRGGKFYTEGSYMTDNVLVYQVADEVREMRSDGKLPGISGSDWTVYVNTDSLPDGYPLLIL